jgi:WD40 repeat protein
LTADSDYVRLWDVATGITLAIFEEAAPGDTTWSMSFSPDGKRALFVEHGVTIRAVDPATWLRIACTSLREHPSQWTRVSSACPP